MPTYDFVCDNCNFTKEVHVKADWRDSIHLTCPDCGTPLRRCLSVPMVEIWGGKFGSRALKKTNYDGAGSDW